MGELDKIEEGKALIVHMQKVYDAEDRSDAGLLYVRLENAVAEFSGESDIDKIGVLVWEFLKGQE